MAGEGAVRVDNWGEIAGGCDSKREEGFWRTWKLARTSWKRVDSTEPRNKKREKVSGRVKGRDVMDDSGGRDYWRGIFPVGCFACLPGLLRLAVLGGTGL